ncbi:diguanylate cyclase (GGDEF) domain-containing protein [Methylobacterium sp. ap11]|jgi:diguanylate cyclase (GGDEF)-like protein|nr:diguanylate cyclase (GGDEF) domain-containing protein [Methylobacterium sp. ap11]
MDLVHAYAVALYALSLGCAVFASFQTMAIMRLVQAPRLKLFWCSVTGVSIAVEALHAVFTVKIAFTPSTPDLAFSATILLGAGGIFASLTRCMRASILDVQQVATLKRLAYHDPLTEIGNRRAFDASMAEGETSERPATVILFDVDHFKSFNDGYGHDVGDLVLKHLARLISATAPGYSVYRIGGEEFAIVAPIRLEEAAMLANLCRASIELVPLMHMEEPIHITASAGVAQFRPGETVSSVMRRADQALYAAKRAGRNRVIEAA